MTETESPDRYVKLKVIRGSVDSLSLYEITDYELEIFEKGGPSSTYFNVAISLLSIGVSFLASILTVEINSIKTYILFSVIMIVGISGGIVSAILWHRTRSPVSHICEKIRARVPANPISVDIPAQQSPNTE